MICATEYGQMVPTQFGAHYDGDQLYRDSFDGIPTMTRQDGDYKQLIFPCHCGDWHGSMHLPLYPSDPTEYRGSNAMPAGGMSFQYDGTTAGMCGAVWNHDGTTIYCPEPDSTSNIYCAVLNYPTGSDPDNKFYLVAPKMPSLTGCLLSGRFKEDSVASPTWDNKYAYYRKYMGEYVLDISKTSSEILYYDWWYCVKLICDHGSIGSNLVPQGIMFNHDGSQARFIDYADPIELWYSQPGGIGSRAETIYLVKGFSTMTTNASWMSFPRLVLAGMWRYSTEPYNYSLQILGCGAMIRDDDIVDTNWSWHNTPKPICNA